MPVFPCALYLRPERRGFTALLIKNKEKNKMLAPTAAQKIIQQSNLFIMKNGKQDERIGVAKNNDLKLNKEIIDAGLNDNDVLVRKAWLSRYDYTIPKNMVGRFIFKQNRFERIQFFHHVNFKKEVLTKDQFLAGMNDPSYQCRADCISLWLSSCPEDIPDHVIIDALEDYSEHVRSVVARKCQLLTNEQELSLLNDDSAEVVLSALQRPSILDNIDKIDTKQIIDRLIDESRLDHLSSWLKSGVIHFDAVDLLRILDLGKQDKKQAENLSHFMSVAVNSDNTTINREAAIELRMFFKSMDMETDIKQTEHRYKGYVAERKALQRMETTENKQMPPEKKQVSTLNQGI